MTTSHYEPPVVRTYPPTRLMAAVLRAVVEDVAGASGAQTGPYGRAVDPRDARLALAYVASTDRAWPFSFENVCDALGIDAGALRARLKEQS